MESVDLTITIVKKADGQMFVSGPVGNRTLMYGLLEEAKDAVRNYDPSKRIVTPPTETVGKIPLLSRV